MTRLSPAARAFLELVQAGRVTYGDLYPARSVRAASHSGADPLAYALLEFMVDGVEVYGQQKITARALDERGLIATEGHDCVAAGPDVSTPLRVILTAAGTAMLG